MSSTANAASVGQIRSGLRALGESLRRGRRKVCPVLGLIEIETASKSLFSLSVQNVSVCAKSNVGTLVMHQQKSTEKERVMSKDQERGKSEDGMTQNGEGLKRRDLLLSGT